MGDISNLELSWRSVMMAMVCLPVIICMLLLFFKRSEKLASRLLATTLGLCVLAVVPQIIGFANFYDVFPELTFFPFATDLYLGPLIYLHAHALLKSKALGWRKLLILPGLMQTAYYTWAFISLGDYQNKWEFSRNFHSPYIYPIESALGILLLLAAMILVWRMYLQYKHYVYNTESVALEFDPIWLKRIIIILLIAGALFSLVEFADTVLGLSYVTAFPFLVLVMLSIAWLSIEAVWRINQHFPKMPESPFASDQITSNELDEGIQSLAKKIDAEVKSNQWFLEPRFSLKQLSHKLGSNEVYVSKAINKGLKLSFNDYINSLRIQHAKLKIKNSSVPLLTIALDSGFNSKATFNRVFKDLSGQTPSQFKNNKSLES